MRNLYLFFRKHYFIFLFLVLEVFSLVLFFNYNNYQNAAMYNWNSSIAGRVNRFSNSVLSYFYLKQINMILAEENAVLKARMPEAIYLTDTSVFFRDDSMMQSRFRYINARVISNSTDRRNNYIMIDKGELQGVDVNMGVISGNYIVGQVVGVSRHFSWIISFLHSATKISAKFLKNNQLISIDWPGGDYHRGRVMEIPKHLDIRPGDTIVTSGNSEVFPPGIIIGTIEKVIERPDENFNRAEIVLLTDFNGLGYVEVVVDMFGEEKEQLKASFE